MRQEETEGRIQNLEIGLQSVMLRLEALETKAAPAPRPETFVQPPPIIKPLEVRPQEVLRPEPPKVSVKIPDYMRATPPAEAPKPEQDPYQGFGSRTPYSNPQQSPDEIEYKFGINGLLRGGAVVVVVAVLFLVAQALSRGWITPTMQFIGEIMLCLGFIGIGVWKHNEREDFGQLMVGVGSFGLYASFAGAYAYKHLFEGETLVTLYMLLSLINLGFSHWKASKSFLCIGLIGGLVAAIMPMHKDKVMLDFALHFAILVPCAAIIVRNKWNGMGALMWGVSSLALLPATTSDFLQAYRVGATYLNCAIALYVTGKVFKESDFDRYAAIQSIMLFATGCFAIGIDSGHKGSLHAIVLTAIGAGVAYLIRDNLKARNSTLSGSLAVLTILAPIGFQQNVAAFTYALEALLLAGLALRFRHVALNVIGLVTMLFSFAAYLYNPNKMILTFANFSAPLELLLLAIYTAAAVLNVMYALKRTPKEVAEMSLFLGGSLVIGFFIRGLNIALGNGNTPLQTEDISSIGVGIASLVTLAMAGRMKRTGIFVVAAIVGVGACFIALIHEPSATPMWISPTLLLMATGTVILTCRYMIDNEDESIQEPTLLLAGLVLSAFFVRLLGVVGAKKLLGLAPDTVVVLALGILNVVWTGFAVLKRRVAYLILGWGSFVVAAVSALTLATAGTPVWLPTTVLAIPIVTVAVMYWASPHRESDESAFASIFAFSEWGLVSFLLTRELSKPSVGLKEMAALTISWVLVATILIICGFKSHRRYLRYWSLGIFMVTVGKVFLVDLAELDSFIRVMCLMLLGIGMVGGGYWYILWRRSQTTTDQHS